MACSVLSDWVPLQPAGSSHSDGIAPFGVEVFDNAAGFAVAVAQPADLALDHAALCRAFGSGVFALYQVGDDAFKISFSHLPNMGIERRKI
jgi:hypothetical protein